MTTKMIVGLGNPGPQYAATRHNIGFQCVELFGRRHQIDINKLQNRCLIGQGVVSKGEQRQKVLLVKPMTFMNLSGEAVGPLARFFQIEAADMIVIHDDLDLASGKVRLRTSGSSGGQNGIKSIIQHIGTQEFARIKVGIGRPPGRMDPADYVLQAFTKEEDAIFSPLRHTICDAIESWIFEGIAVTMNRFNGEKVEKTESSKAASAKSESAKSENSKSAG